MTASGKDRRWPEDPPPIRYTYVGGPVRDLPDAAPPLMPGGESTSVQLANARAELEQERAKAARLGAAYRHMCDLLAAAVQERDDARACWSAAEQNLTAARAENGQLRADLTAAHDELEQLHAATNDKETST